LPSLKQFKHEEQCGAYECFADENIEIPEIVANRE
jgi:hypothetical protein